MISSIIKSQRRYLPSVHERMKGLLSGVSCHTSWKAAKKEKAQKAPTAADDEDIDAVLMEFSTQASFGEKYMVALYSRVSYVSL